MNRTAVASLALLLTGAGGAFAQRPSVVRVPPKEEKPAATPSRTAMGDPPPRTSVVRVRQESSPSSPAAPLPSPTPLTPTYTPPSDAMLAPPTPLPPASPAAPHDPSPFGDTTYASRYVEPCFWFLGPRRNCGTVYLNTPYFWIDAELMIAQIKKWDTPVRVTTAPVTGDQPLGGLDSLGTQVIFDGSDQTKQPYGGGRFEIGGWCDECQYYGARAGFFFLARQGDGFVTAQNTNANPTGVIDPPGLYVPFTNATSNTLPPDAFAVAQTGFASGAVRIQSHSQMLGADGHFLCSTFRGWNFRVDGMVGFRYLALREAFSIDQQMRVFPNNAFRIPIPEFGAFVPVPVNIGVFDYFNTHNNFYGGDIGYRGRFERGSWSLDMTARIAMGLTHHTIRTDGLTSYMIAGIPPVLATGGRFVLPNANLGTFNNDAFSVVPQLGAAIGYQPCHWLRLSVGYDWLAWTRVVRPGDQIDTTIDPAAVLTRPEYNSQAIPTRPAVPFRQTDFWMQSVTVGVQFLF